MKHAVRAWIGVGFIELIRELGGDPGPILAAAGVDENIFKHPDAFVAPEPLIAMLNIGAETLARPDLGLLWGERTDPSILGPLYLAMSHAATGRQAMDYAARYLHTQTRALTLYVVRGAAPGRDFVGYRHYEKRNATIAQLLERNAVIVHRLLGELCGAGYGPDAIWFQHAQIGPAGAYRRALGVTPTFRQPETGLLVRARALDVARPRRSAEMKRMAEQYLRASAPAEPPSIARETANMIAILLRSSDCTPQETARAMGMHERTLQRRLQAEGVRFEQVKDDVRRGLARSLLGDANVPLTEIAFALGYASAAAFSRSARRWFDQAPGALRKTLLAEAQREPTT